jgi:hypothetical protein
VSLKTQALLGSYQVQAVAGDNDESLLTDDASLAQHFQHYQFAPKHTGDLLQKIHQLHKQHKGQTMAEAELNYLNVAKGLNMYGVDLHKAKVRAVLVRMLTHHLFTAGRPRQGVNDRHMRDRHKYLSRSDSCESIFVVENTEDIVSR